MLAVASTAGLWAAPASAADTTPPTQPGTIAVSSLTATSAKLTFAKSTDNVSVEGYRVYRGTVNTSSSALTFIATRDTATPYTATQLFSNTGYKFDPNTGQPLQPSHKFDPYTGKPLDQGNPSENNA